MDFISIILSAFSLGRDHAKGVSDRRIESYRLNAEVAAEALGCASLIALAMPNILRRASLLFFDQPEVIKSVSDTLMAMKTQAEQLYAMAESNKQNIEKAGLWIDWDKGVRLLHEWRATVSLMRPHVESVIQRYEDLLNEAEIVPQVSPSPTAHARPKDRGWDSPPL